MNFLLKSAQELGLLPKGERVIVLLSGGGDSVCLLDLAVRLNGPGSVVALHVNYGLREASDGDERHCRDLCSSLAVELIVEQVTLPAEGNLQANARSARYALARAHADRLGIERIAVAHTASDQAETVLYRLAASPGRRALLGMRSSENGIVRPLLQFTRAEVRAYCEAAGLTWREDLSNADPRFARARVRGGLLPELTAIHPAAEQNIVATAAELADEAEILQKVTADAIAAVVGPDAAVSGADLEALDPALARLVLRELAERATGRLVPLGRGAADRVLELAAKPGSATLDLADGLRAVSEYGRLRFEARATTAGSAEALAGDSSGERQCSLAIPGQAMFGSWLLSAASERGFASQGGEVEAGAAEPALPDLADAAATANRLFTMELNRAALSGEIVVRKRADGDRMRPAGLGGTKSLQDLFVDRKIPQAERASYPIVCCGESIAWVPGLAVAERFKAQAPAEIAVVVSAQKTA